MAYVIPDPLRWTMLAGPLAAAEDALARLDERLGQSPIRDGWVSRTPAWCRDRSVGAEELSGVGERPLSPCPAPGSRSCPSSSTRTAVTIFRASSARSRTGRPTTPACASVEV